MATEPAWLRAARAKLGTREAPGAANNATIMGWAAFVGGKILGALYNADSVPWCGLFVAACMKEVGLPCASIAVRASSWATYGANLRPAYLSPGAILVFHRDGGGHVAFYAGEDATHYHVLGGNQGDCVTVMRILKSRLVASRWPTGIPVGGGPVKLRPDGAPVSGNER